MLWYCATSPRSSAPWARRRATVSSMSSTANMTRCRPSVLGGGFSGSAPDAVESDGAVRPKAFDLPLAFQLHAELGEERDSRVQVVDDDCDVVHPLNGHVSEHKERGHLVRDADGFMASRASLSGNLRASEGAYREWASELRGRADPNEDRDERQHQQTGVAPTHPSIRR